MLKASTVTANTSWWLEAVRAMMLWSPCVPQRAWLTSPWPTWVGLPVDGPPRWTLTMTQGISAMQA